MIYKSIDYYIFKIYLSVSIDLIIYLIKPISLKRTIGIYKHKGAKIKMTKHCMYHKNRFGRYYKHNRKTLCDKCIRRYMERWDPNLNSW
jgi:hypothetical protein